MADRPEGYGMTAEVQAKLDAKYDVQKEREAMAWLAEITGDSSLRSVTGASAVHEKLKDGVILCSLINKLQPGSVPKVNSSKMAFKMMENIGNFLDACEKYGVKKLDLFQTVSLYEATNMTQVIDGIHALGRKAGQKGHRGIGPKESATNKREFSDQQLRAGEGVIGLQAGYNKGASQAGQNFGKTRAIIDWFSFRV